MSDKTDGPPVAKDRRRRTLGVDISNTRPGEIAIGWALIEQRIPRQKPPSQMRRDPIEPAEGHWQRVHAMVAAVKARAAEQAPEGARLRLYRWSPKLFPNSAAAAEGATYDQYILMLADVGDQLQLAGFLVDFEDIERDID